LFHARVSGLGLRFKKGKQDAEERERAREIVDSAESGALGTEEEDDDDDGALLYDVALVFAIRPGKIPESPRPRVVSFARMEILVWGGSSSRLQNDSFGELSWDLRELW